MFEESATDPDKEGTGLGLALVKQIIDAHGGTLLAASTLGAAAKFTFTIPSNSDL